MPNSWFTKAAVNGLPPGGVTTIGVPALHPENRCDRCRAHAFFRVAVSIERQQWLDFCWHHFKHHEIAFRVAGYNWEDQSHRIPGRETL